MKKADDWYIVQRVGENGAHGALWKDHRPNDGQYGAYCDVCQTHYPCAIVELLDELATLQSFYQATVRLESQLGRPETVDIERVLGITPPVLTDFWAAFDAVPTEQRI